MITDVDHEPVTARLGSGKGCGPEGVRSTRRGLKDRVGVDSLATRTGTRDCDP
ncbi:hypothetical protein P7L74_26160 [Tistrella mobilis]|uniref:hypothetical protein n=1 Tax=Tistrella mobilis TaxID=171437 RepID=UPI0035562091